MKLETKWGNDLHRNPRVSSGGYAQCQTVSFICIGITSIWFYQFPVVRLCIYSGRENFISSTFLYANCCIACTMQNCSFVCALLRSIPASLAWAPFNCWTIIHIYINHFYHIDMITPWFWCKHILVKIC